MHRSPKLKGNTMKKTIAIFGITALSLSALTISNANAGVSVHFGRGVRFSAPSCAPAPVVTMAPMAPCAPVYVSMPAPPPVVVYAAPPRVHVSVPCPIPVPRPPRVVLPAPVISFRPPFFDVGFHFGHHRSHRHCR